MRSAAFSSGGVSIGGPAYAVGASSPSGRGISTATASAPVCTRMISAYVCHTCSGDSTGARSSRSACTQ